jgi:hypothetical protein
MRSRDWATIVLVTVFVSLTVKTRGALGAENNATGKWTWSQIFKNGEAGVSTLDLKQEGKKLSGTLSFSGGAVEPIKNGKVENGKISFELEKMFPIGLIKTHVTGTIKDDTLEMKWDPERNGKKGVARTVKAKRVADRR